jgi:hypothetical protein
MNAWDWMGYVLVSTIIIGIMSLVTVAISSEHQIRDYYLRTYSSHGNLSYNIYNDVEWSEDTIAFTTDDEDKAVATLESLKATLR